MGLSMLGTLMPVRYQGCERRSFLGALGLWQLSGRFAAGGELRLCCAKVDAKIADRQCDIAPWNVMPHGSLVRLPVAVDTAREACGVGGAEECSPSVRSVGLLAKVFRIDAFQARIGVANVRVRVALAGKFVAHGHDPAS